MQQLDVRLPMGLLFLILGVILVGFGLTADPAIYAKHSLGQNVNLTWGVCFALFGAVMLFLAAKAKKRE
jgi:hypothetical protein